MAFESFSDSPSDKTSNESTPDERSINQSVFRDAGMLLDNWFDKAGVDTTTSSLKSEAEKALALSAKRNADLLNRIGNLKRICAIAKDVSVSSTTDCSLDADWFFAYVSLAENVYSKAMQELWGKILAVEVNAPGSFSLRSLETIRQLTERDAHLFRRAVSMASWPAGSAIPRILVGYYRRKGVLELLRPYSPSQVNLTSFGLSYPDLLALIDLKLLFASEIESSELEAGKPMRWRCGKQSFSLEAKKAGTALIYYKFTSVGAELFRLFEKKQADDYVAALHHLMSPAFTIENL